MKPKYTMTITTKQFSDAYLKWLSLFIRNDEHTQPEAMNVKAVLSMMDEVAMENTYEYIVKEIKKAESV